MGAIVRHVEQPLIAIYLLRGGNDMWLPQKLINVVSERMLQPPASAAFILPVFVMLEVLD